MKMIQLKFGTMVLSALLLVSTVYGQHQHAESMKHDQHQAHGNMYQDEVPLVFQEQLKDVFDAAQTMNAAFVLSNPTQVQSAAKEVKGKLESVDMKLLQGQGHVDWMEQLGILSNQLEAIDASSELPQQREALAIFSDALFQSVKSFGIGEIPVYQQYCPMANGNAGASWLSANKEIRNPYFGAGMLSCGSTKAVIE